MTGIKVRRLDTVSDAEVEGLADVLIDVVAGGASVSFMYPFTRDKAIAFWRGVAKGVEAGERAIVVAEDEQGICGTAQLILSLPENQPHRADLAKMLVHRRARRRGIGAAVLKAVEDLARQLGKTLLVLDTASQDAERLYERAGWIKVGVIPDYALMPDGAFCDTIVYYRRL
jgi:GNAT superfamily N-acetyltransferase